MNPKVIYETEDLAVLDKPAGMLTHPAKRGEQETLASWILKKYPEIHGVGQEGRFGIVHRLDKETSGLLVVAKNQKTYELLKKLFHDRRVEKRYLALVWGAFKQERGIIEKEIAAEGGRRRTVEVWSQKETGKTRAAATKWRVAEHLGDYSLLDIQPLTGRTHQIRVHLKSIGHPIVCDPLYSGKKFCPEELRRMFLHAYFLKIPLASNVVIEMEISLPDNLQSFLRIIR